MVTSIARTELARLKKLHELGLTLSGDPVEIFQHVARMIGELLDVKIVCLSEPRGEDLEFLAVYANGEVFANAGSCKLAVTPCATVEESRDIKVYDRVIERFPEATFLQDHNAHAYCGFPSLDNQGKVVAVTCLLDDKPHHFSIEDQEMLRIFGQRIGMEIERKHNLELKGKADVALGISEERLHQAVRVSRTGIFDHDHLTDTIYWSPRQREIYGWGADEPVTLQEFAKWVYPEDRERIMQAVQRAHDPAGDGLFDVENRIIRRDGEIRWLTTRSQTFFSGSGETRHPVRTVGAIQDITERKMAEEKIQTLAFYDSLTRLPNRSLLKERLGHAIASRTRVRSYCAILFLDLDNFKVLNDTQGHQVGDELLVEVAERLKDCVREVDTVARLGGDEFIVLLEDLDEDSDSAAVQAKSVAEKIIAALREPYYLSTTVHHGSTSIGVVLCDDPEERTDSILAQADTAMYQAKKSGKNTYRFFDPDMQHALEQHTALETALRQAIVNEQLRLFYQVQVDAQGQTVGVEALIRWQHPELGLVSPVQFIPLAEETGLILGIGQWVLETACAQLKVWNKRPETRELSIAVNVSARQFYQPDFVDDVRSIMQQYDIEPSLLKLELTESMVLEDIDMAIEIMQQLKSLGAILSMDDFGTGYSSLSYLRQLPFDQLKIDKSFVSGVKDSPDDAFIVHTVITLGQKLGMNIIAEGVEDAEQCELLKSLGCTGFQGYHFGMPVPVCELNGHLYRS